MTETLLAAGLRIRGLRKSYGPVRAVDGVDLDVVAGETVALLGPNGAGKSTTIDVLLGLTDPDAGEVTVFGRSPAAAARAGLVGAMLQTGGLISEITVRELVALAASLYPAPMPVGEVLDRADLTGLADRRTTALSGGQAQRMRFALALVPDPELLVLDEPTAAMDVASRRRFWASMRELTAAGRTVLFATHHLEEADQFAGRVVLLAGGRVVAGGTAAAVKAIVGGRTVRVTLPRADTRRLGALPGVTAVEVHGDAVALRCTDSDAAARALLAAEPAARDLEVGGAPTWSPRSSPSPRPVRRTRRERHLPAHRGAAHAALTALLRLRRRHAGRAVPPVRLALRRRRPGRDQRPRLADGQHGRVRRDGRRGVRRRPDLRRAVRRLDPAAAADPAARPHVRAGQGGHRAARRGARPVAVYAVGAADGVRLPAGRWAEAGG